jgi:acylphosphatase
LVDTRFWTSQGRVSFRQKNSQTGTFAPKPITIALRSKADNCRRSSIVVALLIANCFLLMADLQTRRYVISGRVQGVGFRWFVEREAAQIGVAGWVRNRENGDVEVMATGTREQHGALRARLQQGPRAARVDQVSESPAPLLEVQSFRIEGVW